MPRRAITDWEEFSRVRFWPNVRIAGDDNCWEWTASTNGHGYCNVFFRGKYIAAHRFAFELQHGEDSADGRLVHHSCDNPRCVNHHHLLLGTTLDNRRDAVQRDRARGRLSPPGGRKITVEQAQELITLLASSNLTHQELAGQLGISRTYVTKILNGRLLPFLGL